MSDEKMSPEDAVNVFDLIASSPRPVKLVEFPKPHPVTGEFIQIGMRPLTHKEIKSVNLSTATMVDKIIKDKKLDPKSPEIETIRHNRHVVEIMFRACRNPNDETKGAFTTPEVLENLDDSALETLWTSYIRVRYELGERIGVGMNEEEINDWINALAEGGEATAENFSDRASPLAVTQLLSIMASRLIKLSQDTKRSSLPVSESVSD